jgi:dynein heavy chain 1
LHHNPNLKNVSDHHRRREILLNDLFLIVYKRTSRALLHHDHVMLAVLLAQVKLRGMEDVSDGLEFLLESGQGVALSTTPSTEHPTPSILTPDQMMHLESYAKQSLFKPVLNNILENPDDWIPFLQSSSPETIVPTPWEPNTRE